jgi:hypothetical protein
MEDDNFELFSTIEEAFAFIKGYEAAIELIDDDHTFVSGAKPTGLGEWRVDYDYYV